MKNEEISSSPTDVKSDGILELRISKRLSPTLEQRLSAFRFFPSHRFCFKQTSDNNWHSIPYTRALEICERTVERAYNGQKDLIIVRGTLLPHLLTRLGIEEPNPSEDSKLAALHSGQKIILG